MITNQLGSSGGSAVQTVVNLGTSLSGVVTCNLGQGTDFVGTQTGNVTLQFSNFPGAPDVVAPTVRLVQGGAGGFTIKVPGAIWATQPIWNTNAGGVNLITIYSDDQGAHLFAYLETAAAYEPQRPGLVAGCDLAAIAASGNPATSTIR